MLLDTNVLSEVRRPEPDRKVLAWLDRLDEDRTYISVISLAEIRRVVVLLDEGRKRAALASWVEHDLPQRFAGRVLPVDGAAALAWGDLMGEAKKKGTGLNSMDAMIAATTMANGLTLATRNTRDFQAFNIDLVDPWSM